LSDPENLEAVACREGIALAEDLALSKFQIASDCQNVVTDMKQGAMGKHSSILREIKARSTHFENCSIVYEGRASNLKPTI
jgi:hypothetical protein